MVMENNGKMVDLQAVQFHDDEILTYEKDGIIFVMMKPVVESLELDWRSQRRRINSHPVLSASGVIMTLEQNLILSDRFFLPLQSFHGWLLTLHPKRISDETKRAAIIRYQHESFQVIHAYWYKGTAINPRVPKFDVEHDVITDFNKTSGVRFKEERERLGYFDQREFADFTGLRLNQISNFEELNMKSENFHVICRLIDIGFDFRYWQTGGRSNIWLATPEEVCLLKSWNSAPQKEKDKIISILGA